ncbi:MAG: hypothetical protein ACP5GY_09465 [Vulcanisaeta sp.]
MAMFGVALTTFIQLRRRSDVLAGIFSTSTTLNEVGRLTGAFIVLPIVSLSVPAAFIVASIMTLASALILLPYVHTEALITSLPNRRVNTIVSLAHPLSNVPSKDDKSLGRYVKDLTRGVEFFINNTWLF